MQIRVVFHALLRDRLPPQSRGRAVVDLPEGSVLADLYPRFALPPEIIAVVNGQIERDHTRTLVDGDEVRFFRQSGGGR